MLLLLSLPLEVGSGHVEGTRRHSGQSGWGGGVAVGQGMAR